MTPLTQTLSNICQSILTVLRAFAAWTPPVAYVVTLGHTTYTAAPARRPQDNPHLPDIPQDIRTLLRDRANRAMRRLLALFAQWQAGTLPKPLHDFPRPKPAPRTTKRRPYTRLPRSRAWAGARVLELRQFASQLSFFLHRPEVHPFLDDCPQAGRLLRPLSHAIGAQLPPRLAPPKRAPLPRRPRAPRPRHPSLADATLKLRPWEIRAIRSWRKKFGPD